MKTDTIAAIATAMTNSGIGIIRISGEDAFTVIDRIYQSKNGKKKLSEEKAIPCIMDILWMIQRKIRSLMK